MVEYAHAGHYGPEIFEDGNRKLLREEPVTVYLPGTNDLATLYTDRTKSVTTSNPFLTDELGNGEFYANPAEYEISYAGTRHLVTVPLDFDDTSTGPRGAPGGGWIAGFLFSTTTTDGDPGPGRLRLSNATQNLSTVIRADLADVAGMDITNLLGLLDDSDSTVKGILHLFDTESPENHIIFTVSSMTTPTGYRNITVVPIASSASNPFTNNLPVTLAFTRTGDRGTQGIQGEQGDLGNTGATGSPGGTAAPVGLPKWRKDLAGYAAGVETATAVALGDSLTEGAFAGLPVTYSMVYDTAGTHQFVVPPGVTAVTAKTWGASGGSGSSTLASAGGGSGGGAYSEGTNATTPGEEVTIVVGAGGNRGDNSNGGVGGDSYWRSAATIMAKGGAGGQGNGSSGGGAGGAAASGVGTIKFSGGNGGNGGTPAGRGGGGGGSAGRTGNGGAGSGQTAGTAGAGGGVAGTTGSNGSTEGADGVAPGGGAGGAGQGTNLYGGFGATGKVVVEFTIPGAGREAVWTSVLGKKCARLRDGQEHSSMYLAAANGSNLLSDFSQGWAEGADPWTRTGDAIALLTSRGLGARACVLTSSGSGAISTTAPSWATHAIIGVSGNGGIEDAEVRSNNVLVGSLHINTSDQDEHYISVVLQGSANTLQVKFAGGLGNLFVSGVLWQDHSHGSHNLMQIVESGHNGRQAEQYANQDTPSFRWASCLAFYNPSLVIITLGVNDAMQEATKAQFKNYMETVIDRIDAACASNSKGVPDILLVGMTYADLTDTPGVPYVYTPSEWEDYLDALDEIAAAMTPGGRCVSIRLQPWMDAFDGPNDLNTDGIHLTRKGAELFARAVFDEIGRGGIS